ncbi:MAG: metallophosphoesterase [Pyrinomonadaceae bacterium]
MVHLRPRVVELTILWALVCVLACPLSSPAAVGREIPPAQRGVVLSLSDIHFNPFYDAALVGRLNRSEYQRWRAIFSSSGVRGYGSYSADTNYNLMNSALEYARQVSPRPDFVIISGDFLSHNFQQTYVSLTGNHEPAALESFIDKTIAFITLMIEERFPNTPVYPALGNNDSYCGDYNLAPGGRFLARTAQTWKGLIKERSNVGSFLKTFPASGSYVVSPPGGKGHRLIVLNTVFLSRDYANKCGDPKANPAQDELSWFGDQLRKASASKERVWLLAHIPPGVDVFSSIENNPADPFEAPLMYYGGTYNQQYLNLMNQYASTISHTFAGHTHMDSFQLVNQAIDKRAASAVTITPAISPIYGNNPGFKVFTYDRQSSALIDYTTYYLNLGAGARGERWGKEYAFGATYGQPSLDPVSLQAVYLLMPIDYHGSLTSYGRFYNVSDTAQPVLNKTNWSAYWCGIGYLTPGQFTWCQQMLDGGPTAPTPPTRPAAARQP